MRTRVLVHVACASSCALLVLGVESVWPRTRVDPAPAANGGETDDTLASAVSEPPALVAEDADAAREIAAETEGGRWDREAIPRIRARLRGRSRRSATDVLVHAGFEERSAKVLAGLFRGSDAYFAYRVGDRRLLVPTFERNEVGAWTTTLDFMATLVLPFHPKLPSPLVPPPGRALTRGNYEGCEGIGRHRYESAVFSESLRCTLRFRGHRFHLTTSTELLRDDWSFADRIDHALSNIPEAHLALVERIVIDPGEHPKGHSATTSVDGTEVTMFLAGAGKQVKQATLDETTAHELGHVLSDHQDERFWWRWYEAMSTDKVGVSAYGMTNAHEDFAEAYVLYLGGGSRGELSRRTYAARFRILDALFAANG